MHRSRAGGVADWFSACSGVFSVFLEFTWSVGPRAVPQSAHVLYAQRARSRDREQLRVSVTVLDPLRPRVAENPAPGLGRIRAERSYLPGNSRRVFPGGARASARADNALHITWPPDSYAGSPPGDWWRHRSQHPPKITPHCSIGAMPFRRLRRRNGIAPTLASRWWFTQARRPAKLIWPVKQQFDYLPLIK